MPIRSLSKRRVCLRVEALEARLLLHGDHDQPIDPLDEPPVLAWNEANIVHHVEGEEPPVIPLGEGRWVVGEHHTTPGHGSSPHTHYFAETGDEHHFAWLDQEPGTPDTIDLYYDFRTLNGFTNLITDAQRTAAVAGMALLENATLGRLRFSRNTTAPASQIINIGTGDLAALGFTSSPRGVLALGGGSFFHTSQHSIASAFAWMDMAEAWDTVSGNGNPAGTFDYATVAAHEVGHAIGLGHTNDLSGPNLMNGTFVGELTAVSAADQEHIQSLYGVASTNPATVQLLDDGDPGFATQGAWDVVGSQGYQADVRFVAAGSGTDVATWTFTVSSGLYRVSATWSAHANRASNAPYSVLDGSTELAMAALNQELAPNDFSDAGTTWEDVTTSVAISGTTMVVRLTNAANEFVIADAVRIERIGDLPSGPEIQVLDGAVKLADGGSVGFGSTPAGTPLTRTFTVYNVGNQTLSLSGPIQVPAGFSLVSGFGSTSLAPAVNTTFVLRFDASTAGTASGTVSFGTNDADENPFNFTVSGTAMAPTTVQLLDDGDAGFATVGGWGVSGGQGYQGDVRFGAAGSGTDSATWMFTVSPGLYRVSATWSAHANRASDAPYSVLDGSTVVATAALNQELTPDDFSDAGTTWEDVTTSAPISGTTMVVRLTNAANEFVIADAVRIERIGDLPSGPEIQVLDGSVNLADGGSVSFGSTTVGTPLTRTFTVTNVGNQTLTLSSPIQVPAGFSVVASFGSTSLAPSANTTFVLRFDAAAAGTASGTVSFGTNDADENPFNFTVSGTATAPTTVQLLDDGDPGFATQGDWVLSGGQGYQADVRFVKAGSGTDVATWTFTVAAGLYRVSATWSAHANRASNAPYSVLDGSGVVATTALNQELTPDDFSDVGTTWEDLTTSAPISGTTLVVRLTNAANEFVIADAVRIERVGDLPSGPEIQVFDAGGNVADGGGVAFGSTPVGSPLTRTFTVSNVGNQTLSLSGPIQIPAGFSVVASFGSTSLAPGASTTFVLRFDAATAGTASGTVSFGTNDADEALFNFTVSGTATAPTTVQLLDDGDTGFATQGAWSVASGQGFQADVLFAAAGSGADVATWTFSVSPGQYRVSATWFAHANRATNAPYSILDGPTVVATAALNQELTPNDLTEGGATWEDVAGAATINGTTLVVRLTSAADEFVIADAVRIERIGALVSLSGTARGASDRALVVDQLFAQPGDGNPLRSGQDDSPSRFAELAQALWSSSDTDSPVLDSIAGRRVRRYFFG